MDGGPQLCSKNSDRGLKIVGPSEDQRQIIVTGRLGMASAGFRSKNNNNNNNNPLYSFVDKPL